MFRYITCGTLSLRVLGAINFLATLTNILISSLRYTPLFTRFRRMAWISRTVFLAEVDEKEEENNEEAEAEPPADSEFLQKLRISEFFCFI